MSETGIINDFQYLNISERDAKGYNFEVKVNSVLNDIGISYLSNPLNNIKEWKSRQGKGSDFKIPLWNWELEAKYSEGKVFPSWIDRDWIPRFKNGTFRVTVHNREMKLSTNSLEKCFIHDIYLIEISYLKYVLKIEMKHRQEGNKLIEAKNSKRELGNNINLENKSSNIGEANKLLEAESNEKEVTNDKNESENSKRELDPSDLEKERSQNNEARTEEKTNGLTLNDYTDVPSESTLVKCSSFSSTFTVGTETVSTEKVVQNDQFLRKESYFGTTFNDKLSSLRHNPVSSETTRLEPKEISYSSEEISFDSTEISPSLGKISTIRVKIRAFYNRLKTSILNLLSGIEMLFSKIWKASRRVCYGCSQRMST
jgi:hypothetical protein